MTLRKQSKQTGSKQHKMDKNGGDPKKPMQRSGYEKSEKEEEDKGDCNFASSQVKESLAIQNYLENHFFPFDSSEANNAFFTA